MAASTLRALGVAIAVTTLAACGSSSGTTPKPRPAAASSAQTSGHLVCTGTGSPTIVLEPGEGGSASSMDAIRSAYDGRLRVCGHDRAGDLASAPSPRTAEAVVGSLKSALEGVPSPYVLVGTSAGGLVVQAFAARHPDEVAGVVAMNPVPPWPQWSAQGLAAMTASERKDESAYYRGENEESLDYVDLSRAARTSAVPFELLISTEQQCEQPGDVCHRTYPAYTRIMRGVAQRWPEGQFSQVPASHDIYADDLPSVQRVIDDVMSRAG